MWYRVTCGEVKAGELTQVHLVDVGNVAFLNSKNMKKLPIDLMFHPSHVYRCILSNNFILQISNMIWHNIIYFSETTKKINANKLKVLEEYENTDCEFTVIKKWGDNEYLIKFPWIEDILV